jgi:hypothetical protein
MAPATPRARTGAISHSGSRSLPRTSLTLSEVCTASLLSNRYLGSGPPGHQTEDHRPQPDPAGAPPLDPDAPRGGQHRHLLAAESRGDVGLGHGVSKAA